jgi:ribonuclease D
MNIKLATEKFNSEEFLLDLNNEKILSIDTEFVREKTYFPILSLIQIAINNKVYLFDYKEKNNHYDFLKKVFSNKNYLKIFHDCEQDIEILNYNFSINITNVFDTQLGNAFTDLEHNISYKNLAKNLLGVDIDKKQQKSNWLKRPFSSQQIKYAANDVFYLQKIYKKLMDKLIIENKYDWYKEEINSVIENILYKSKSTNSWEKIKLNDNTKLDKVLLKKISQFREEKAKKRNIPKSWFLRDKDIIKICSENFLNLSYFKKTKFHMNKNFYEKDYDEIYYKFKLHKIKNLKKVFEKVNVKKQQEILKDISTKFNVSETLIANKKILEKKFSKTKKYNVNGWRKQFFETIIQETIKNRIS